MTAVTAVSATGPTRTRWTDLCAAEWIKFWSLRSTPIALGFGLMLSLYLAFGNARHGVLPGSGGGAPGGRGAGAISPERAAFDGFSWLPAMIGAGLLGAQAMVGEYASGLIRTTFAAVPDRARVGAAKMLVVAAVAGVSGLIIAVGGLGVAGLLGHGASPAGSHQQRAIWASVLLLPICALAGMALGTLSRRAAAAGTVTCAVFGFLPVLLRPDSNRWATDAANALPYYAWGRLTDAGSGATGSMSPAVAWATLAAWAAASILITVLALARDV